MHQKVIKSWEALWAAGTKAGGTHWNYSRGMVRFRPMRKAPAALGIEALIDSEAPVRVRFYGRKADRYVERFRSEVLFQPPPPEEMPLPPGFASWDPARKRRLLDNLIKRLSSRRQPPASAAVVRSLIRALEIIRKQISANEPGPTGTPQKLSLPTETRQKPGPSAEVMNPTQRPPATQQPPPLAAEARMPPQPSPARPESPQRPTEAQQKPSIAAETRQKPRISAEKRQPPQGSTEKQPKPPTSPEGLQKPSTSQPDSIKDFWEFIAHPKAEERVAAIVLALTHNEETAQRTTELMKRLPILKALGMLSFK